MAWDTSDLSSITDTLITMVTDEIAASPMWTIHGGPIPKFTITPSGAFPDVVRKGGCDLTLTLVHASADAAWRNTPTFGSRPQPNAQQPLALDLTYLVSAWAGDDFHQEQQAMSIALACFQARPIFKTPHEEFTIVIEPATLDELSRTWQSITVAMRLAVLLRVAVVFLKPRDPTPPPAAPPTKAGLVVAPAIQPLDVTPQLFGGADQIVFQVPPGGTPDQVGESVAQALIVPGKALLVGGQGLDQPQAAQVYLASLDGTTEWKITSWRTVAPLAGATVLDAPAAVGLPAGSPPPGAYRLMVGKDAPAVRSDYIIVAAAPRIDGVTVPPTLPPGGGGIYTINGAGFTSGATQVALDGVALSAGPSPPAAGKFFVNAAGTTLTFRRPAGLPNGRYQVILTVGGVRAPPGWWIDVP